MLQVEWVAAGMLRRGPDCMPAHPRLEEGRMEGWSIHMGAWSPEVERAWRFLGTEGAEEGG